MNETYEGEDELEMLRSERFKLQTKSIVLARLVTLLEEQRIPEKRMLFLTDEQLQMTLADNFLTLHEVRRPW